MRSFTRWVMLFASSGAVCLGYACDDNKASTPNTSLPTPDGGTGGSATALDSSVTTTGGTQVTETPDGSAASPEAAVSNPDSGGGQDGATPDSSPSTPATEAGSEASSAGPDLTPASCNAGSYDNSKLAPFLENGALPQF